MNLGDYNIYNDIHLGDVVYSNDNEEDADTKFVKVDDCFLYIIQQLNIKGYNTKFCCSGHYGYQDDINPDDSDTVGGYIYFERPQNFSNLPKGVYQENSHIIRYVFDSKPNTKERSDELNLYITNISNWVDSLNNIN